MAAAGAGPRIAPGDRRTVGLVNAAILWGIGRATGGKAPNVFTTLARHRRLFRRWLFFAGALMPGGQLPRRDAELVILRVAHNTGSEYEWAQHERIGARAGLGADEIACVREGAGAPGWTERQRLLLEAVDELGASDRIGRELWAALGHHLEDTELIELCLLAGHYRMLAGALNSIEVEPDPIPTGSGPPRWLSRR